MIHYIQVSTTCTYCLTPCLTVVRQISNTFNKWCRSKIRNTKIRLETSTLQIYSITITYTCNLLFTVFVYYREINYIPMKYKIKFINVILTLDSPNSYKIILKENLYLKKITKKNNRIGLLGERCYQENLHPKLF